MRELFKQVKTATPTKSVIGYSQVSQNSMQSILGGWVGASRLFLLKKSLAGSFEQLKIDSEACIPQACTYASLSPSLSLSLSLSLCVCVCDQKCLLDCTQ